MPTICQAFVHGCQVVAIAHAKKLHGLPSKLLDMQGPSSGEAIRFAGSRQWQICQQAQQRGAQRAWPDIR